MITLIGVGHVFDISKNLENEIIRRNPQVVCVELDPARYQALYAKERKGDLPFIYMMMARFQEKIAKKYGAEVGSEMITAIETAKTINARLAFIDKEASKIISEFWNTMTFSERVKLMFALFTSVFVRKKRIERELERFEENDQYYMESFGREFPTAKTILIDDRNAYMAESIIKLNEKYENIVAVIGDGHVEGIKQLLQTPDVETVRLSQLRKTPPQNVDEVTISYEVEYNN
jgi:pheromone shutdown protein TraB